MEKNIKRSLLIIATLTIIFSIMLYNINKSKAYATTGKIISQTTNLREEASTDSKILVQLPIEKEVEILSDQGEWYKVSVDGVTGYIMKDLLTVDGKIVENTEEKVEKETVIKQTQGNETENTNTKIINKDSKLKLLPLINSTDLLELKNGDKVVFNEIIGNWTSITVNNINGWIMSSNISEVSDIVAEVNTQPEEVKQEQSENIIQEEKKENSNTEISNKMYVNWESVNLRSEPNTTSTVIKSINKNEEVEVVGTEGDWTKVKFQGLEGYISSSLLSTEKQKVSETEQTQTPQASNKMYVNWESVNLRSEPNTTSAVIKSINKNEEVQVLETEGEWTKVKSQEAQGYVLSTLLSTQKQSV